jgi:hypothetical protein
MLDETVHSETKRRPRLPSPAVLLFGAVLLLGVALLVTVGIPHWQKLRLMDVVEAAGGTVQTGYHGPEFLKEQVGSGDRGLFSSIERLEVDGADARVLPMAASQSRLVMLALYGPALPPDGLRPVAECHNLTSLTIAAAGVTDAQLVHLQGLALLRNLRLQDNPIKGSGIAGLSAIPNLEFVDLTSCPIDDAGLFSVARLKQVQTLDVSYTLISDAGVRHLEGMPELQTLDLQGTTVGDECLDSLSRIPKLQIVILTGTRVTREGCAHLQRSRSGLTIHAQQFTEYQWP